MLAGIFCWQKMVMYYGNLSSGEGLKNGAAARGFAAGKY